MINSINDINFKGIYTHKFAKFSEPQQKIYDDIKTKLSKDETKRKWNFLINPKENDSVELYRLDGMEEEGRGVDKHITYQFKEKIGRYDKNHPFETKDVVSYLEEATNKLYSAVAIGTFAIAMMVGGIYISATKKTNPQNVEKSMTVAKDSVQSVVKDSLKIFK